MATKKTSPVKLQIPANWKPIDELYDWNTTDLYDLHDRLWYEYFTPGRELNKDEANFIRVQLNAVGAQINIEAADRKTPMQRVIMVEPSTTFAADELGPNIKKPVYIETAEPLKIEKASHFKTRSRKLESKASVAQVEDLLGEESNEDLLGEVKPSKKGKQLVAPVKKISTGSKTNYEVIAELAAKGLNKDQIVDKTGFSRKTVTDNLWRYNKTKGGKK